MDAQFVFAASCLCLVAGCGLCFLPANRYLRLNSIDAAGALFLVCGVVLMTTFKWTEVAIKVSGLEVRLAEAEGRADEARMRLALVRQSVTPEAQSAARQAVLATYKEISSTDPSEAQLADFTMALNDAQVTMIPATALTGVDANR